MSHTTQLPVSQTQISQLPKEVQKLLKQLAELWHTEVESMYIDRCNEGDLIDTVLALIGDLKEVSLRIMREGDAVSIWMFDVLGNDWAVIIYYIEGEPQCLVATP